MNIMNQRIKLRAVEETDMDFCRKMINSSYIELCTIGKSFPISEKQQIDWFRNYNKDKEVRLIIETGAGSIGMLVASEINWINRNCEVAIKLAALDKMGPNDTMDASRLFLDYLFNELNMHCVFAYVLEENRLSHKLLTRIGFVQEGLLRQRVFKRGIYHNVAVFSLLREEFVGGIDE